MERSSMSNGLKDHGICCSSNNNTTTTTTNKNKLRDSTCKFSSQISNGEDYVGAGLISWPPRSYTCSFCKREFKSAQALGGHMNVHRRDRARLRLLSPPRGDIAHSCPIPNLNPSPSPNPSLICPPLIPSTLTSSLSALSSPPTLPFEVKKRTTPLDTALCPKLSDLTKLGARNSFFRTQEKFDGFMSTQHEGYCKILKKKDTEINVRLDLEIGTLVSDSKDDDLDLELRLGYS